MLQDFINERFALLADNRSGFVFESVQIDANIFSYGFRF